MGSDDGKKRRVELSLYPWVSAAVVVVVLLALVQYRKRVVEPIRRGDVTAPRTSSKPAPEPSKPASEGALKALLLEIAAMPAREALAALDRDPLGVEAVQNASEWACPTRERLVARVPNVDAERGLRFRREGAFLWFEHLSKAGGTSFCAFARKNVGARRTPPYYCMPSDGAKIAGTDGRVGRWKSAQLREYVRRTKHAIVANEWDAFPGLDDLRDDAVLATVVRDPVDRLVSAYKFWGRLHNPNKKNPRSAQDWLGMKDRAARQRPHRRFPDDFLSQVGRNNFAVWKFASGGGNDKFEDCGDNATCDREALLVAIDRLEAFHVAAPMLWQHAAAPLYRRLGWTDTAPVHRVPTGTIQNSDAKLELGQDYERFREANVFDYVLWTWLRRAFLERVRCPRPPIDDPP
ncbi:hypothetical protein CTAYLR_005027 [Chrysophaeum taylorii]|uniref:Uncharacterized protein n=1 Tax=Chrysophaeum taylorii TaxID=2483200 RepID=A0AAD7UCB9_9STRA|nr:hypothetical protein CTAYLR_005027 [Chrysophaeum taylorii]